MFGFGGGPEEVDETELYDLLGVEKTASSTEIKKAYRKKAMRCHPDRGGDAEEFKKINAAHEILSDAEKRKIYDQYGMKGLEGGGGGGGGAEDIFAAMFGGGRRRGPSGPRKTESISFPLAVTMEEAYCGTTKKLRLTKSALCETCSGSGSRSGAEPKTCGTCRGRGVEVIVRQIGPGMLQQMQTSCRSCGGSGSTIPEGDKCDTCTGARTVKKKQTLEVHVNRGIRHGEKVVFRGAADEAPGHVPGDVVIVIQVREHEVFKRRGQDLFISKEVSLNQALTGFEFAIEHLDGRTLHVRSTGIIKPSGLVKVAGEGFPSVRNPFQKGHLFVEVDMKFPDELADNTRELLRRVLPDAQQPVSVPEDADEVELEDVDIEVERARFQEQQQREQYEEDEEHGQPGGCRQA